MNNVIKSAIVATSFIMTAVSASAYTVKNTYTDGGLRIASTSTNTAGEVLISKSWTLEEAAVIKVAEDRANKKATRDDKRAAAAKSVVVAKVVAKVVAANPGATVAEVEAEVEEMTFYHYSWSVFVPARGRIPAYTDHFHYTLENDTGTRSNNDNVGYSQTVDQLHGASQGFGVDVTTTSVVNVHLDVTDEGLALGNSFGFTTTQEPVTDTVQ